MRSKKKRCYHHTIYKVLDKHDKPRTGQRHDSERPNRRIIPKKEVQEIIKKYKSNQQPTAASLAREYGYSDDLILDCLKRNKIKIRPNCKITDEKFEEIIKRYEDGESSYDLSGEFGIAPGTITSRLHRKNQSVRDSMEYKNTIKEEDIPKIVKLYSVANMGSSTIAKLLGYWKKQILETLNSNGVDTSREPSFYSRYNNESERKLIKSLRGGLEKFIKNQKEIADLPP